MWRAAFYGSGPESEVELSSSKTCTFAPRVFASPGPFFCGRLRPILALPGASYQRPCTVHRGPVITESWTSQTLKGCSYRASRQILRTTLHSHSTKTPLAQYMTRSTRAVMSRNPSGMPYWERELPCSSLRLFMNGAAYPACVDASFCMIKLPKKV